MARRRGGERGSGLLSTVIGVSCIVAMLGVASNVAIGLWTRSSVDAVAYDAARDVATAPPTADRAQVATTAAAHAREMLGAHGRRTELTFEALGDDDVVTLRVRSPGISLLPALVSGGPVVGAIDRRIVVRRESRMSSPERARGQSGVVGGSDGLLFGMLILVVGAVVLINVWAVIDTRAALDAAARDYLRSYSEQADGASAASAGQSAARRLLDERGTRLADLHIEHPAAATFGPCAIATVRLTATVASARLPFIDDLGTRTVSVTHSEMVDPHREVIPGAAYEPDATPCGRE